MQSNVGTDWNRHHGVGATLLANWVEERAAGKERVLEERSDIAKLSKNGHKEILVHSRDPRELSSTSRESYTPKNIVDPNRPGAEKERQEAELFRKALEKALHPPVDRSAKDWVSTHHADFSHEDIYGKMKDLGEEPPSEEDKARFLHPITFWSDYAVKGSGTTIASNPSSILQRLSTPNKDQAPKQNSPVGHRAGQEYQHRASGARVKFGRHCDFSIPIAEYLKGPVKDL
ncbi:hypothetical protein HDU85_003420 [Gaertneriomyces sp. JEL0708]|nr:hypothetical protein HDU85_003420 [Gaertneriomyces sp. JEL0708]